MSVLDLFDLGGQTAVVTGGGSGLGRGMAIALAEAGANVVLPDINLSSAEQTADLIHGLGRTALPLEVDVARPADVERCFDATAERFGHVDILVNNAGIGTIAPTLEVQSADWQRVFDVNVNGVFHCCVNAGRYMVPRGRGKIVNIASVYGMVGVDPRLYDHADPEHHQALSYNASKGAVINLTRSLAVEWAPRGIQVNAIAPGMMQTDKLRTRLSQQAWRNLTERTPLRRAGTVADLCGAVVFLASAASDFVTGHTLVVDGGWTAW